MVFLRSGLRPSLRKSKVLYHKVTAILILFQLAIAICEKNLSYLKNIALKYPKTNNKIQSAFNDFLNKV